VEIIEDDSLEKDETFTIEFELEDKPGVKYGENKTCTVTIAGNEELQHLAVQVAGIISAEFDKMNVETDSWGGQFIAAMSVEGEPGAEPVVFDYVMHLLTFGWKLVFACIPPTSYSGGWATFGVGLGFIGLLTAFVADIASIFGCLISLPDTITAITFVALGTSLPDTFASKTAAVGDPTADASISNVTGSNSVNVFLGLGLPWLIATISHSASDFLPSIDGADPSQAKFEKGSYVMVAGDLGLSVVVFCVCAVACLATVYWRRFAGLGELGGPEGPKKATAAFFLLLWFAYVMVSSLKAKRKIDWSI
jgi:solute carrier family 8 (sodium/calcium exchanger)